jgi:rSAM/selenodomain-associated transferase 1
MFHLIDMRNVLLIFIKNPEAGKVKTRLAKSIGALEALQVYEKLLARTLSAAGKSTVRRQVWYSSFIDNEDDIPPETFEKYLQTGSDLGERMKNAFRQAFEEGADNVVIIGSDCPDLNEAILESAFEQLKTCDLVIGPSEDGGYYLLGMNRFYESLFRDVEWSTESVLTSTIDNATKIGLNITQLPVLNDIDTLEDLRKSSLKL